MVSANKKGIPRDTPLVRLIALALVCDLSLPGRRTNINSLPLVRVYTINNLILTGNSEALSLKEPI